MFVELFFKADTYKVKDFAKSVADLPFSIAAAGAALVGMDLGFIALTSSTMDMANSLMMFRAQTGETTDDLERWQMAARRVGVSNEVVTSSFQRMISSISQLKTFGTGPAGEMFGRLGISGFMEKSPTQLMSELRSKYQSMDRNKFSQIAGGLIDPSMMRVFESNYSSPQGLSRLNPVIGQSGLEASAELTESLTKFTDEVRTDFIPVLVDLIPVMKEFASDLAAFLRFLHNNKTDPGHYAYNAGRGLRDWMDRVANGGPIISGTDHVFMPGILGQSTGPRASVTVHQNFFGDVDKNDIDAGVLSLEHALVRTSRQLNKAGR